MKPEELIRQFPSKRLRAMDGLAVTADVWEEAHEHHRVQHRFHAMLNHGAGIVTGLEVVASDPADTAVYVMPGIAYDSEGHTIVVEEPTAYDIGRSMEGPLYLILSYDEGKPVADSSDADGGALYVHSHFSIAAGPALPAAAHVELARLRRTRRDVVISNAKDAQRPGLNEIDLRYRRDVGVAAPLVANVGVAYLGGPNPRHGTGVSNAVRAVNRGNAMCVYLDDQVDLRTAALDAYALLYVAATNEFQMSPDEMTAIYHFVQGGGTVLFESCRHELSKGNPKTDSEFMEILGSFGLKLGDLKPGDALLRDPALFAAPPGGFEPSGSGIVQLADGMIFSTYDYGCLWQGERRGGSPARDEIRSAIEWAGNLITYAAQRRTNSTNRKA